LKRRASRNTPERILVARNDKLGDFILTLPCFHALRRQWPDAELVAYVPEYTRDVAAMCPAIDRVVIDPQLDKVANVRHVAREWRENHFDILLALRSYWSINVPGLVAGIPLRIGPRTNLFYPFFNHSLDQNRSRSIKPEWDYNLDLVRHLFYLMDFRTRVEAQRPVIELDARRVEEQRHMLMERYKLDPDKPLVFVHPGQSGTTNNLRPSQYMRLVRQLRSDNGHSIVLTAGPGELELAQEVSVLLGDTPHVVHNSAQGLQAFAELIANADLFIASSTGTLHLAGALDRPTAGFFERRLTKGPLRWQTLNSDGKYLSFSPPDDAEERDVQATDVEAAVQQISEKFLLA